MSGEPGARIAPGTVDLLTQGYLHNVVRLDRLSCSVCGTNVSPGFSICRRCERHRQEAAAQSARLASQVVPIVYAVHQGQSGHLMRTYKQRYATDIQRARVRLLGQVAFQLHRRCLQGPAVDYQPISAWSSVPSTSGRSDDHPMHDLAAGLGIEHGVNHSVALVPGPDAGTARRREFAPARWATAHANEATGHHVLLVDDTWASGAKAQSASAALFAAGARAVSVLVIARWMDRAFTGTNAFLTTYARQDYSPYTCPISGGPCPPWGGGIDAASDERDTPR